jgi:hypothetical protein
MPEPRQPEPPIENVLDEFVPEWRDGELTGEEVVALFRERAAKEMDDLLDIYNALKGGDDD